MARRSAAVRADELSESVGGSRRRLTVVEKEHNYADVEAVRDFAAELPERFLHCRELGHNWRPHGGGRHPDGGYERVLRCSRCRTKREQSLDAYGMVMTNQYIYPEGYEAKELGRIVGEGRGVLRLESITRLIGSEG